jgi:1,2-diacylglycerol 3-beta-glucosyltransferase
MIELLLGVVSLAVIATGVVYFATMMTLGWWEHRHPTQSFVARDVAGVIPTTTTPRLVIALIPCLDEELVIAATVQALSAQELPDGSTLRIVVIDDGSTDGTADAARAANPDLLVIRRELPMARQGKGAALNHAYRIIVSQLGDEGVSMHDVAVCVIDADGRLSPGALSLALAEFADERIGAVQLQVRIRNRGALLPAIQDLEFWGFSAMTQLARRRTRTVSLGGNGQFTRLSALASIGPRPWSDSLTEDLDLALSMAVCGWSMTTVLDAWVDQQGVTTVKALLRQRTRWFQGHMSCARRIPEILRSPRVSSTGAIELTAYLAVPYVLTLPWSIVGQWALAASLVRLAQGVRGDILGDGVLLRAMFMVAWYLTGFFPTITLAAIYRRRAGCTRRRALLLAHVLLAYNYLMYVAAWRALWRIVRRKKGWSKTQRLAEPSVLGGTL